MTRFFFESDNLSEGCGDSDTWRWGSNLLGFFLRKDIDGAFSLVGSEEMNGGIIRWEYWFLVWATQHFHRMGW